MRVDARVRMGQAIAAALEGFGIGVAVVDPRSLRFDFVSETLASMLGSDPLELLGLSSALDRVAQNDVAQARSRWSAATPSSLGMRLLDAKGDALPVEISARPFDGDRGGRALVLVVRGTSERVHREALERALDDATRAVGARDEVLSIASHELRSPLTSLRLHAQALARGLRLDTPDVVRARRSIAEVERHADRLARLLDHLLDAARLRSGKLEIERAPVDLGAIVREVVSRLAIEAARTGATLIVDGERHCPGHWDPFRLDQIVTNLVSNAIKYGGGTPVAVEITRTDDRAILSVRDYGPGIPTEEQERIFEPFERGSNDARVRGAGLGLWIVKRLVEAHGGSVCVVSVPGRGAQFLVQLPRGV